MKKLLFLLLAVGILPSAFAQLKVKSKCNAIVVDILDGKVNDIKPSFSIEDIKTKLPCFTSAEEESATAKCGGGVFYKDKDLYFYTGRDYVEIGEKFTGQLSVPLMGAKRNTVFKYVGNPKLKDDTWDAFQTQYGTLILHYNTASKVNKIQFSPKGTDVLNLCD